MGDSPDSLQAFFQKYGTEQSGGANAFGKCVSQEAHAQGDEASGSDESADSAEESAHSADAEPAEAADADDGAEADDDVSEADDDASVPAPAELVQLVSL